MDWAHVLIWIVCIATGLNVAILLWTRAGLRHARSWLWLQLAIFLGTLGGAFVAPQIAALAGGISWFVLVMAPSLLLRLLYRLSAKRQYAWAIRITDLLSWIWLHAREGLRTQRELLTILLQISQGHEAPALARLEQIAEHPGPLQQTARYFSFYLRDDWQGLLAWLRQELSTSPDPKPALLAAAPHIGDDPAPELGNDPAPDDTRLPSNATNAEADATEADSTEADATESDATAAASTEADSTEHGPATTEHAPVSVTDDARPTGTQLFWMIRALAETGQLQDAIAMYQAHEEALANEGEMRFELWAVLTAFAGHISTIEVLLHGPLFRWAPQSRALLQATAELACGHTEDAENRLHALIQEGDPTIQHRAKTRLAHLTEPALIARSLPDAQQAWLEQTSSLMMQELRYSGQLSLDRRPWLTWGFVFALCVVFGVLEWRGGSTTSMVLLDMGAMVPALVLDGQWWRLMSFPMLHYGAIHLVLNAVALLLFGPFVERTLGVWRFLLLYVASGIGGGALITAAVYWQWMPELRYAAYVGASGAIFGLLGGMIAILCKGWLRDKVLLAKRRIGMLLLIVGLQTAFDLNTPKVSMGAHLTGLCLGLLMTLVLWSPPRPAPLPAGPKTQNA